MGNTTPATTKKKTKEKKKNTELSKDGSATKAELSLHKLSLTTCPQQQKPSTKTVTGNEGSFHSFQNTEQINKGKCMATTICLLITRNRVMNIHEKGIRGILRYNI